MLNPLANIRRRLLSAALLLSFAPAFTLLAPAQAAKPAAAAPAAKPVPDSAKLDINTATLAQLKALPGIGDVYSQKIIAGRPYTAKNQLTSRGIIPQATYDKIKDTIIAHQLPKK
jgi:DNA uptake protein ComE-like DNA-binding protein